MKLGFRSGTPSWASGFGALGADGAAPLGAASRGRRQGDIRRKGIAPRVPVRRRLPNVRGRGRGPGGRAGDGRRGCVAVSGRGRRLRSRIGFGRRRSDRRRGRVGQAGRFGRGQGHRTLGRRSPSGRDRRLDPRRRRTEICKADMLAAKPVKIGSPRIDQRAKGRSHDLKPSRPKTNETTTKRREACVRQITLACRTPASITSSVPEPTRIAGPACASSRPAIACHARRAPPTAPATRCSGSHPKGSDPAPRSTEPSQRAARAPSLPTGAERRVRSRLQHTHSKRARNREPYQPSNCIAVSVLGSITEFAIVTKRLLPCPVMLSRAPPAAAALNTRQGARRSLPAAYEFGL